jgi:acyl transferase domain-containing protein
LIETQVNGSAGIAIIGMAGRFPSAENLEAFWQNLADGVESITTFSEEEMLDSGVRPKFLRDPNYVPKGTVLERPEWFDARFFGYSAREAEIIDPQQRVFLELAWEALENAGYSGDSHRNRIAVYAGTGINTYLLTHLVANPAIVESFGAYQTMLASDKDFLATRVSYELNLQGPSLTVQTACSTSLVAVQIARESLLSGQCDIALAGGVSISFPGRTGYLYTEGMILSNDGHCRPFDADARGTRAGSGAGIVVMKRLDHAIRDGDSIHAVIRGAAINNDGSGKLGYTAPSIDGQAEAIAAAQKIAGVHPEEITYIEAHGTGTVLGDPVEVAALDRVFRARTDQVQFCGIGSLKGNLGHLDAAAGVAGLIKTVLALQHRAIPPSLNYRRPNPQINFAESPFYVNDRLREWKTAGGPRIAGVSSFGIGGTNAHVIVEEAPPQEPSHPVRSRHLLLLSAKTETALDLACTRLGEFLQTHPESSVADVCYTLQVGRRRFPYRRFSVVENREQAMEAIMAHKAPPLLQESISRPVAFLFPGQGSQHPGMTAETYRQEPVFRRVLDECSELLRDLLGCDLREVLYPRDADAPPVALNQTRLAQPALFAVEYAMALLWMSWGIEPEAMIGHSIGEYVAACLAGVFSLSDALSLVAARGAMMQALPSGAMLAISLPAHDVTRYLGTELSLAAINSPCHCTVSGTERAVADLEAELLAGNVPVKRLHTSHAFHSAMMDPILAGFTERVRQVRLSPPRLRYISNLTGSWIRSEEATDPAYWAKHLRHTVQFAGGVEKILDGSGRILLELGPGQTLSALVRQICSAQASADVISALPHPRDPESDSRFSLRALGRVWAAGGAINWERFHEGEHLHRIPLPTYPFERQRHCVERTATAFHPKPLERNPDVAGWFYVHSWTRSADPTHLPVEESSGGQRLVFLDDSGVGEKIVRSLARARESFVTVKAGNAFSQSSDSSYTVNPARREDFQSLFQALAETGLPPRAILHLWNTSDDDRAAKAGPLERHLPFYGLIFLIQAWNEYFAGQTLDLLVVSKGLHRLNVGDRVQPGKSLIVGPCRVIPAEYVGVRCRSIDLPDYIEDPEWTADALLRDFDLESETTLVAYRGGQRWEHRFEPVRLREGVGSPLLRNKGVYLITGGFGGIGFTLARYLAEAYQARLVLTSRSSSQPSSGSQTGLTPSQIEQVSELRSLGAEVLVVTGDITDRTQMESAVADARCCFGPIHGVVHAAGVWGGGAIELKSAAEAERVFGPKVEGTMVLAEALAGESLDFIVLCSSITAAFGGFGESEYCSANAFLDAWAVAQSGGGLAVISIGWDAWQTVGMAARMKQPGDLRHGILPAEGLDIFRRTLSARFPSLLISTRDPAEIRRSVSLATRDWNEAIGGGQQPIPRRTETMDRYPGENGSIADAGREAMPNDTARKLHEIWSDILGNPSIRADDDFFALGGHSLLAAGMLARVRSVMGMNLPLRTIFDAPTIRTMSERIDTLHWALSAAQVKVGAEEREDFEL